MNRFFLTLALVASTPALAQITVLTGGNILTVDQEFSTVEAMAFRDTEIIAMENVSDVRSHAGSDAGMVDLGGKMVMPGFMDPHTDFSVSVLSPLEMVAVPRTLFTKAHAVLADTERASIEVALRAVTGVPAFQLMSGDEIGSLEVGKLADFVVLTEDPTTISADKTREFSALVT